MKKIIAALTFIFAVPLFGQFIRYGDQRVTGNETVDGTLLLPGAAPMTIGTVGEDHTVSFADGATFVWDSSEGTWTVSGFDMTLDGDLDIGGVIKGAVELEFSSVTAMLNYDFSSVSDGARVKCNGYNTAGDQFFGPDVFWDASSTATADGLSVFDPVASGAGRLVREFDSDINVRWAGALGNGSTDDSSAIQAVIDYIESQPASGWSVVYVPSGRFLISSTLTFTGNYRGIRGDGQTSRIVTTSDIPMVRIDCSSGNAYYFQASSLSFEGGVSGTRTSNTGIEVYALAGSSPYYFNHFIFTDLLFAGTYRGIHFNKAVAGPSNEARVNWGIISNVRTTNLGANQIENSIDFSYGSGTGNVIEGCTLLSNGVGINFSSGALDIQHTGTAVSSTSTTIVLDAGASGSDDTYNGYSVAINSGTGANQIGTITDYVGSTKTATVSVSFTGGQWAVNPDATSVFTIAKYNNIGDITVNGSQFGYSGTGINFDPIAHYRRRVSITNCQFDGGVNDGIIMINYGIVRILGCHIGGATTNTITYTENLFQTTNTFNEFILGEDTDEALKVKVLGDVSNRFLISGDSIEFGDGSTTDVNLYRDSSNSLKTDDDFRVGGTLRALGVARISGADVYMGAGSVRILTGTGDPNGVATADIGSTYMRTDGGTGTTLYIKESGTGNTGWVAK